MLLCNPNITIVLPWLPCYLVSREPTEVTTEPGVTVSTLLLAGQRGHPAHTEARLNYLVRNILRWQKNKKNILGDLEIFWRDNGAWPRRHHENQPQPCHQPRHSRHPPWHYTQFTCPALPAVKTGRSEGKNLTKSRGETEIYSSYRKVWADWSSSYELLSDKCKHNMGPKKNVSLPNHPILHWQTPGGPHTFHL